MNCDDPLAPRRAPYKSVDFTDRFDKLLKRRGHRSLVSSRAVSTDEARFLARKLRHAVGVTANDAALLRVLAHNLQVIRLAERVDGGEPGFVAYLPLNTAGYATLIDGRLSRRPPDADHLSRHGEAPVALYVWCVYAQGNFIPAIAAITARLFASLGFVSATDHFPRIEADILVVFAKDGPSQAAPVPVETAAPPKTVTSVARNIDETLEVFAIRSAPYIADQACPYDEEFDGNDFCAAHILGEIDGEPAGCIRIRFFADFVKFERLAVRPEFRKSSRACRLVRAAIDYARVKGFGWMYGHAPTRFRRVLVASRISPRCRTSGVRFSRRRLCRDGRRYRPHCAAPWP